MDMSCTKCGNQDLIQAREYKESMENFEQDMHDFLTGGGIWAR